MRAATEALFVKNFAGFDYIVAPSGSCVHHVREHLTAIQQTPEVQAVRAQHLRAGRVPARRAEGREFPWAEFPHKVGLHNGCSTLRGLRQAKIRRSTSPFFSKPLRSAVQGEGIEFVTPERPDECCGFGGTFSVFEEPVSAKMGYDKVNDHHGAGAEYIVSRRHVLHDAPAGLRRAAGPADQIHPHRAGPERSPRHESAVDHAEASSKFIQATRPRRVPRQAPVGPAPEARPREPATSRSGRSCARSPRRSRNTR